MAVVEIIVVRDFSKYPAGRYKTDGPFSGEHLRQDLLVPALKDPLNEVIVDLGGALGYSAGFLEEAFGGLVRVEGFKAPDLQHRLLIAYGDQDTIDELWSYIFDAQPLPPR